MIKVNECLFCEILSEGSRVQLSTEYFFVILDEYPVNKGHALIIPKWHQPDLFSLDGFQFPWGALGYTIDRTKEYLDGEFHPDGYNIGINCGKAAGQTIEHLHIHIIPRYKGDVKNPRGGIRNFKTPLVKY